MNLNEIVALLEENDDRNDVDVILYPPDEDELTDEDSDEEDNRTGMDVNRLGQGLLRQQAEIQVNANDDGLSDVDEQQVEVDNDKDKEEEEDEDDEPGPSKRPKRSKVSAKEKGPQLKRVKNGERIWSRNSPADFGDKVPAFQPRPPRKTVPEPCCLPYDFLRLFLHDEFLDNIVVKSKLYSVRKGGEDKASLLTKDNFLSSMAIMYVTGYLTPCHKELFWEKRLDTENTVIRKAMPRDTFKTVLRFVQNFICFPFFISLVPVLVFI